MAMLETPRKKHEMRNYDFCYGAGVNWYDMEKGQMYHIQEYKEALEKGERPKGIRVTIGGDIQKTVEWIDPVVCEERMKDPEPDPRY